MNEFKNLRIRAFLRSGVICDPYLPLDSIVFYHAVREKLGDQIITKSRKSTIPETLNIELPFKKLGGDLWYYACSFAQFSKPVIEHKTFKVKKGDWIQDSDFFDGKKKIAMSRGKFKAARLTLYYKHCSFVEWFCVGDPEKIAHLLRFCTHLGKNSGDGWGEVMKWEINDFWADWSVYGKNNKLMRNIPLTDESKSGQVYGIRPSYWFPENQVICEMP